MNMTKKSLIVISIFSLSSGIFLLLSLMQSLIQGQGERWQQYTPVLYATGLPEEEIRAALKEFLAPRVILTAGTTLVEFSRFDHSEEITVSELSSRLDPRDPRLDGYLQQAQKLFTLNPDYQLAFITTEGSLLKLALKVLQLEHARGYNLILPDLNLPEIGLKGGLGVLIFVLYLLSSPKKTFLLMKIGSFIPWLLYILTSPPAALLLFICLYACWFRFFETLVLYCDNKEVYKWSSPGELIPGMILLSLFLAFSLGLCLQILKLTFPLLPLLACGSLGCGYLFLRLHHQQKKKHRLFRYIPFYSRQTSPVHKIKNQNLLLIFVIILVITSIPLYYSSRSKHGMYRIPVPLNLSGVGDTNDENIITMLLNDTQNEYPDTATYLKHLVRQSTNNFIGQSLTPAYPTFTQQENGVITAQNRSIAFDIASLRRQMAATSEDNLAALLLTQGEETRIQVYYPPDMHRQKFLGWMKLRFYFLWLIPLFFLYFYLTPSALYGIRNLIIRRMHITA